MRVWPWIVGGGIAAYAWSRQGTKRSSSSSSAVPPLAGRWVWPVQSWKGRQPVISDGFDSPRPGLPRHGGVDIMFKRLPADSYKPGTPNGSKGHIMPDDIAVLAASDGVVWSAMQTPRGYAVVIDHGSMKVATFYAHIDKLLVTPTARGESKQHVKAGQAIGTVGFSPLDAERLKHLHFELWLGGPKDAVDPAFVMRGWEFVGDPRATVVGDPRATVVARNASLVYRPIGASNEPYPDWVRALKGKAGVYVIRDADSEEIVYVGSSAGRLYDTLTRHFQTWRRYKGFWKGQYAEGHNRPALPTIGPPSRSRCASRLRARRSMKRCVSSRASSLATI